jgi:FkbM family methyltransferase
VFGYRRHTVPLTTLPNGLVVETANEKEAAFLYSEIFETSSYSKYGIALADGATVFDVGANVGLFSASLVRRHRDLRLVLFEPVPHTFAMLERNAQRLLVGARVTLVPAGVSSAPGRTTFELDRSWTIDAGASAHLRSIEGSARQARKEAGVLAWNRAAVEDSERAGILAPVAAKRLLRALASPVSRPFACALIWALSAGVSLRRSVRRQRVSCELTTISAALRNYGIDRVDLVKIDVEGAEWAVLEGIDEADWPRLRQLVLEVHDVDGRVDTMRDFLEAKDYKVAVEQDDWKLLRLQGIRMVYAHR